MTRVMTQLRGWRWRRASSGCRTCTWGLGRGQGQRAEGQPGNGWDRDGRRCGKARGTLTRNSRQSK